jgi:hypothetical protein
MRRPAVTDRRFSGPEPSIEEILDDPVTIALMRSDGVSRERLKETIDAARWRLSRRCRSDRTGCPDHPDHR